MMGFWKQEKSTLSFSVFGMNFYALTFENCYYDARIIHSINVFKLNINREPISLLNFLFFFFK